MRLVTNVHSTNPMGGVELNVFQVSRELARRGHQVDLIYRDPGSLVPDYRKFCQSVTKVPEVDYWYPTGRRGRPKQMAMVVPAVAATIRRRPDLIYGNRIMSTGWAVPAGKVDGRPGGLPRARAQRPSRRPPDRQVAPPCRPVRHGLPLRRRPVAGLGAGPGQGRGGLQRRRPGRVPLRRGRRAVGGPARARASTTNRSWSPTSAGSTGRRGCTSCSRPGATSTSVPTRPRLLVVGSSTVASDAGRYQAELRALATDNVRFIPGQRDVVTPLHASDVVVVPSVWQEPFGRTVIEALSTGRPVVASRVGGIPEILTGPLERFLFEREDADGLAEQLLGLVHWRDKEPGAGRAVPGAGARAVHPDPDGGRDRVGLPVGAVGVSLGRRSLAGQPDPGPHPGDGGRRPPRRSAGRPRRRTARLRPGRGSRPGSGPPTSAPRWRRTAPPIDVDR